jgi:hypothetical protein
MTEKCETHPISKTLCYLVFRILDDRVQEPSNFEEFQALAPIIILTVFFFFLMYIPSCCQMNYPRQLFHTSLESECRHNKLI